MEKLGTVVFDGKMYNLDVMNTEDLEKLLNSIEQKKDKVMNELKKIVELGEEDE